VPFQLRVLGSAEVLLPGGEQASLSLGKPLGVLVYVALGPRPLTRGEVASVFWPEAPRDKALHSLRQALWVLKTSVGEDLFEGNGTLTLRDDVLETDVDRFREALESGLMSEARELWRGSFLEGFVTPASRQWENWVEDLRSELEARFQRGLLAQARDLRQGGAPEEALGCLREALELNPASEAVQRARIELLLDLLRLREAREALADARGALGDGSGSGEWLREMDERLSAMVRERWSREREAPGLELEFVGRSRDLALLRRAYEESLTGRSRVVVVTGPAGIGKTRLAEEFLRGTAGEDALRVVVKGSRAEMKLRWGAVARLVRQILLLPGSAGISSASDSLLRAMIPSLGRGTVNLETVNGVSPVALLDAVRDLLEAVSFEAPMVVHLDDLQWFDGESRTLLLSLLTRPGPLRALFVVSGRPDLSSGHWRTLQASLIQDAGADGLTLEPLALEEVRELLALMARFSDPMEAEDVVRRLHEASGGNPLFLRGLLQHLSDQGVIRASEDGRVLDTSAFPLQVRFPEDIRALLSQRLDRLSPEAGRLAGVLARHGRPMTTRGLAEALDRDPGEVTGSVAELLDLEVTEWVEGEALDFRHDLLREAAQEHFRSLGPERWSGGRRWPWSRRAAAIFAAGVLLAIPLGILWGRGSLFSEEATPPPFGGGTLVVAPLGGRPIVVEVSADPPEEWEPYPLPGVPDRPISGVYRNPTGGFVWYGREDRPSGPDMVRIHQDGSLEPLFPGEGDQSFQDVSPDGGRILFRAEDLEYDGFSSDLYLGDPDAGTRKLLYRTRGGFVGSSRWSPDGDLVAFFIQEAVDTLVVVSTEGRRVASVPLGEIRWVSWCGEDLAVVADPGDGISLLSVSVPEMHVDTVALLEAWTSVACSPDGRGMLHRDVVEGEIHPILRDLDGGEVHVLPDVTGASDVIFWLPEEPTPIPTSVEAGVDLLRMSWGERRRLSAGIRFSDGRVTEEGVRWESLDPAVATVTPGQELTANGAGVTSVLARWGYSLVDTVRVVVEDAGNGGSVYRDRFLSLDTARWLSFGDPRPVAERIDGEPVLRLRGDEKWREGILYRPELSLDQGGTVEVEFRMVPTERLHQNFHLCLTDMDFKDLDPTLGSLPRPSQQACFAYPSREYEKMDPAEASFLTGEGVDERVRLPGTLPPADWTHVAIQVRADGLAALVVDRQVVAVSPVRLRVRPDEGWTIMVEGDAVGTDLLVRNLTIWREVRY